MPQQFNAIASPLPFDQQVQASANFTAQTGMGANTAALLSPMSSSVGNPFDSIATQLQAMNPNILGNTAPGAVDAQKDAQSDMADLIEKNEEIASLLAEFKNLKNSGGF